METSVMTALISCGAGLGGLYLGWSGRRKTLRDELMKNASSGAILHSDVEYIKRGVDDIRLEQRAQGQRIDTLAERVTRVEEASKTAHKRLDRLEPMPRERGES
jgi:hypothetical protein